MDIATTLLEYGAQADAESKAGFTPLHLSAQEGHSDMSSLLLEHQANPNHASKVIVIFYSQKFYASKMTSNRSQGSHWIKKY